MKVRAIIFQVLIAGAVGWGCAKTAPPVQPREVTTMNETGEFFATIKLIGERVTSLAVPDDLFAQKAFLAIYEAPQAHAASATALMAHPEVGTHCKSIAALAMQRLPLGAFIALLTATADSVDQKFTDIRVLETLAFAPLNWGRQPLIVHFDNAQVRAILTRLMHMPALPAPRKLRIRDDMLTGQAKLEYVDYMDMIGRPIQP